MTQRVTAEHRAEITQRAHAALNRSYWTDEVFLHHQASNPQAVLDLLADLDDAEKRNKELEAGREAQRDLISRYRDKVVEKRVRISELEAENAKLKGGLLSGIPVYEPDDVMADLLNERQRADTLEAQLADARAENKAQADQNASAIRALKPKESQ